MPLKVLAVDDSRTIRRIVIKAFKPYDCEVMEAENGVEGLAAAARDIPDLIVLDITMPVMDGKEMLQRLKREDSLKNIPVIMLTAESGKDNVMQIVKMGVNDYMVKPFKDVQLIERVQNILTLTPAKSDSGQGGAMGKSFAIDGNVCTVSFPETVNRQSMVEMEKYLRDQAAQWQAAGVNGLVLDLTRTVKVNMVLVKLIIAFSEVGLRGGMRLRIAAAAELGEDLQGFQETQAIPVDDSPAAARDAFGEG